MHKSLLKGVKTLRFVPLYFDLTCCLFEVKIYMFGLNDILSVKLKKNTFFLFLEHILSFLSEMRYGP